MTALVDGVRWFVAHYGLAALFILLAIEELGVWLPLPGDLLICYFGYRVVHSPHPILGVVTVLLTVTAAVLCGSTLLYLLARRHRVAIRRFSRFIKLDERRLGKLEGWLVRHGPIVIIPGRLIPGLRVPTTIVAGLFAVPARLALPSVAAAAVLWGALYLVLGVAGGAIIAQGHRILPQTLLPDEPIEWLFWAIAIGGMLVLYLQWRRIRSRNLQRPS